MQPTAVCTVNNTGRYAAHSPLLTEVHECLVLDADYGRLVPSGLLDMGLQGILSNYTLYFTRVCLEQVDVHAYPPVVQ